MVELPQDSILFPRAPGSFWNAKEQDKGPTEAREAPRVQNLGRYSLSRSNKYSKYKASGSECLPCLTLVLNLPKCIALQ